MSWGETTELQRFSMWTDRSDIGETERGRYAKRADAIESAEKYWLTPVGLFRVFVKDSAEGDAIVFERRHGERSTRR